MTVFDEIKGQLSSRIPSELVNALLYEYALMKEALIRNDYRASGLQGGRFCEIAKRILLNVTGNPYPPLTTTITLGLNFLNDCSNFSPSYHESLRLHIPRLLFATYNLRNRRNIGHVGGDVDPNKSDALFVYQNCTWVFTELIRLFYTKDVTHAQYLVEQLVDIKLPLIWEVDGFCKILNPEISLDDKILSLLYYKQPACLSIELLLSWLEYENKTYLKKKLGALTKLSFIHYINEAYRITPKGVKHVENHIKFEIA